MLEKIVRKRVPTTFIGSDGNAHYHTKNEMFFLKDENDNIISSQYYCMNSLGDDHYAVCDLRSDIKFLSDSHLYDIIKGDIEISSPEMKWGIIRLTRDEVGQIIPGAEVIVVPYIYDRISSNNLKTATAYNKGKLTYLELDTNKESYGQQIVPCVLNHAVDFSVEFEGFAQCSVDDIIGYLPRNCKIKDRIKGKDLLTKNQAYNISRFLEGYSHYYLDYYAILAYLELTGINLKTEKGLQRQRKKRKIKISDCEK